MPSEFDIIRQYFTSTNKRNDVVLGIGDDAAILSVPTDQQLVQSVDTLISGVHFPEDTSPQDIAYKALAVNLSDMAAMGAEPAWFTLALTLPNDNEEWLTSFSESLSALALRYNLQLVGGDTTHGPLCISITINGFIPKGKALTRSGAQVTDKIYVSGTIGDAALALAEWQGNCLLNSESAHYLKERLNRPTPQIELGLLLREFATACIDLSDGLIADVTHIAKCSEVGAKITFENIPRSEEFNSNLTDESLIVPLVVAGGDDYELCFTIPGEKQIEFERLLQNKNILVSCIGEIELEKGVRCFFKNEKLDIQSSGYQHFTNK